MIYTNEYITIDTNAGILTYNTDVQPGTIILKFTKPSDHSKWCFLETTAFAEAGLEQTPTDIFPSSTDIFGYLPEAVRQGLIEENPYKGAPTSGNSRIFNRESFKRGNRSNKSSSRWGK